MNWRTPCLIAAGLSAGAFLLWRQHKGLDPFTGEPTPAEVFRRANPGLTIKPAGKSSRMYVVRDAAGTMTAYAEFQDGVPAAAVSLSRTGKTPDSVLPEWIPRYPGAYSPVFLEWKDATGPHTEVTFTANDPPQKVFAYFEAQTENAGWDGRSSTYTGPPKRGYELNLYTGNLGCVQVDTKRRLNVYVRWENPGPTVFAIAFNRGTCGAAQAGQAECPEERK